MKSAPLTTPTIVQNGSLYFALTQPNPKRAPKPRGWFGRFLRRRKETPRI